VAGNGEEGFADGVGAAARFNQPFGIAVDGDGIMYVSDSGNNCIRKVMPTDGAVSTVAGNGEAGFADGQCPHALFICPAGLALNTEGKPHCR
jgi:streptogramin lyase